MNKHGIGILSLVLLFVLTIGCGGPVTIDGSSDETFKRSIAAAKNPLDAEERKQFEAAVQLIGFGDMQKRGLLELAADPDSIRRQLKDNLHGKTAAEIIAQGHQVHEQRKAELIKEQIESVKLSEESLKLMDEQGAIDMTKLIVKQKATLDKMKASKLGDGKL